MGIVTYKYKPLGFKIFCTLLLVQYLVPEEYQVPFVSLILIVCLYLYISFSLKHNNTNLHEITSLMIIPFILLIGFACGTFHASMVVVVLTIPAILLFNKIDFEINVTNKKYLRYISYCCLIGIILQMIFYRYENRPRMGYEINLTGAYLFTFFLLADLLKSKLIKVFVIFLSLLLLSRLLILAISFFYFVRLTKPMIRCIPFITRWRVLVLLFVSLTSVFSVVYVDIMGGSILSTTDDRSRLTTINDGSNYERFSINDKVITSLVKGSDVHLWLGGYGDTVNNKLYVAEYGNMPHNEIIKSITQFGLLTTILFFYITSANFKKVVGRNNIEYILPLLLYTQIFWVRFTVVPSILMLTILFILKLKSKDNG